MITLADLYNHSVNAITRKRHLLTQDFTSPSQARNNPNVPFDGRLQGQNPPGRKALDSSIGMCLRGCTCTRGYKTHGVLYYDRNQSEICQAGMASFIGKYINLDGRSVRDMKWHSIRKTYPFQIPMHHALAVQINQAPSGVSQLCKSHNRQPQARNT